MGRTGIQESLHSEDSKPQSPEYVKSWKCEKAWLVRLVRKGHHVFMNETTEFPAMFDVCDERKKEVTQEAMVIRGDKM